MNYNNKNFVEVFFNGVIFGVVVFVVAFLVLVFFIQVLFSVVITIIISSISSIIIRQEFFIQNPIDAINQVTIPAPLRMPIWHNLKVRNKLSNYNFNKRYIQIANFEQISKWIIFNRPGVARGCSINTFVTHSFIHWVILSFIIFKTLSIPNHKSWGTELWRAYCILYSAFSK